MNNSFLFCKFNKLQSDIVSNLLRNKQKQKISNPKWILNEKLFARENVYKNNHRKISNIKCIKFVLNFSEIQVKEINKNYFQVRLKSFGRSFEHLDGQVFSAKNQFSRIFGQFCCNIFNNVDQFKLRKIVKMKTSGKNLTQVFCLKQISLS